MAIPTSVGAILSRLESAGFEAYIVGGCVRDLLLGKEPEDWDVTTSALPEETLSLFHAIPTGLQHGTVTVLMQDERYEVTTFRTDGTYADHRRPDGITFTRSLSEDLARRDLTVNAMAMDARGELTDLFGGQTDLQNRVLRCVGDPGRRFEEDALRIMRTLRFSATLGFSIDPATEDALRAHAEDLRYIAVERLYAELTKLLCGMNACRVLCTYPDALGIFLPEILPCVGLEHLNPHHCYDVWEHIAHSVAAIPPTPVLRWTMLLHDIGKGYCRTVDEQGIGHFYGHAKESVRLSRDIVRRLRFSSEMAERVLMLVDWHDRDIPRTEKGIRRALNQLGEQAFRQLLLVKRADCAAQHPDYHTRSVEMDKAEAIMETILAQNQCFSLKQLAVNGRDLIALGYEGKSIGAALNTLLQRVLEGDLPNERETLLHSLSADR